MATKQGTDNATKRKKLTAPTANSTSAPLPVSTVNDDPLPLAPQPRALPIENDTSDVAIPNEEDFIQFSPNHGPMVFDEDEDEDEPSTSAVDTTSEAFAATASTQPCQALIPSTIIATRATGGKAKG